MTSPARWAMGVGESSRCAQLALFAVVTLALAVVGSALRWWACSPWHGGIAKRRGDYRVRPRCTGAPSRFLWSAALAAWHDVRAAQHRARALTMRALITDLALARICRCAGATWRADGRRVERALPQATMQPTSMLTRGGRRRFAGQCRRWKAACGSDDGAAAPAAARRHACRSAQAYACYPAGQADPERQRPPFRARTTASPWCGAMHWPSLLLAAASDLRHPLAIHGVSPETGAAPSRTHQGGNAFQLGRVNACLPHHADAAHRPSTFSHRAAADRRRHSCRLSGEGDAPKPSLICAWPVRAGAQPFIVTGTSAGAINATLRFGLAPSSSTVRCATSCAMMNNFHAHHVPVPTHQRDAVARAGSHCCRWAAFGACMRPRSLLDSDPPAHLLVRWCHGAPPRLIRQGHLQALATLAIERAAARAT